MAKKKISIGEFNKEFFNNWTKIIKITPHFEEWSSCCDDDEDTGHKEQVISRIDIEFDSGEKLSIVPFSNKEETDEELCSALRIVQYKAEEVNWKSPK